MDFNHRKQLGLSSALSRSTRFIGSPAVVKGTLVELWSVMVPHLTRLHLLILSRGSMVELAELEVSACHRRSMSDQSANQTVF